MKAWWLRCRLFLTRVIGYIDTRRPLRILWRSASDFLDDGCLDNAAALAFYALLSFIPFLIILGALIGLFIECFATPEQSGDLIDAAKEYLKTIIPYLQDDHVSGFLLLSRHTASLSAIGSLSLAISASLFFSVLSASIARIFGTKPVNFVLTRLIGIIVIVASTLLLFFVHYFSAIVLSVTSIIGDRIPITQPIISALTGRGLLWSIPLISLFILVLFVILIRSFTAGITVPFPAVLSGAILFSTLWNGAKYVFNIYITKISSYNIIYGSAAWFIAAILWVYYSMTLLLFAIEFSKTIHREYREPNSNKP